jgi:hypothetical protein
MLVGKELKVVGRRYVVRIEGNRGPGLSKIIAPAHPGTAVSHPSVCVDVHIVLIRNDEEAGCRYTGGGRSGVDGIHERDRVIVRLLPGRSAVA